MIKNFNWKRWYILIFVFYGLVGLFNSFIANNKPIIAQKGGEYFFPAFNDFARDLGLKKSAFIYNQEVRYDWQVNTLVPYLASQPSSNIGFHAPSSAHILGSDELGRDVLAGIVRGCYTSFRIGLFGTLLCGFFGVFLGIASGYFENYGIKLNLIQWTLLCLLISIAIFYWIYPFADFSFYPFMLAILIGIIIYLTLKITHRLNIKKYYFPLDAIINKIIEIRKSIPSLIIVLACLPLFTHRSVNNVILLIVILGWTNFARHGRAETLSLKQREFVTASKMMGADFLHIFRYHLLPNMKSTLLALAISSFTANILLESTLSFLSMGLPPTEVSWGSMIAESRENMNAWWMFVFPGLTLMILVFSLNYFSTQYLSEKD